MIGVWIGALIVGLMLGLLGSGGSILTVPVLVYLVGEPGKVAIAESLGIVTLISVAGAIPFAIRRQIDWRSVLFFGVPGMAGAYGGAYVSAFIPGSLQLLLFAAIMLGASVYMFRRPKAADPHRSNAAWKLSLYGFAVGLLAGLIGVGGGFLIVPALVLLAGLSFRSAVGTSLTIIALNGASGFVKYIDVLGDAGMDMNWRLVLLFGVLGIVGSLAGSQMAAYLSQAALRRGFAVFLLVMGTFILWQNAPHPF